MTRINNGSGVSFSLSLFRYRRGRRDSEKEKCEFLFTFFEPYFLTSSILTPLESSRWTWTIFTYLDVLIIFSVDIIPFSRREEKNFNSAVRASGGIDLCCVWWNICIHSPCICVHPAIDENLIFVRNDSCIKSTFRGMLFLSQHVQRPWRLIKRPDISGVKLVLARYVRTHSERECVRPRRLIDTNWLQFPSICARDLKILRHRAASVDCRCSPRRRRRRRRRWYGSSPIQRSITNCRR